jgi:hypothetical protein
LALQNASEIAAQSFAWFDADELSLGVLLIKALDDCGFAPARGDNPLWNNDCFIVFSVGD